MNNFTFLSIPIDNEEQIVSEILKEVESVPKEFWHFDKFRNCEMLSIYNPAGKTGRVDLSLKHEMQYTDVAKRYCNTLIHFLDNNVYSWMIPHGRCTILKTSATVMNTHIDCTEEESYLYKSYKWRLALKGEINKLFFLNEKKQKVYVPSDYRCYIIDGGHPHSVEESEVEKITVCIGSPWTGTDFSHLVKKSPYVLKTNKPVIEQEWIDYHLRK